MKDYIQKYGRNNGLINIPQDNPDLDGNRCMLRACGDPISNRFRKDVFAYARRRKDFTRMDIDLVRKAFLSNTAHAGLDFNWFLQDRQGCFYHALQYLGNEEEAFSRLSVFEGLPWFYLDSGSRDLPYFWHVFLLGALVAEDPEGSLYQLLSSHDWMNDARDYWIPTAISIWQPVVNSRPITALGLCLLAEAVNEERSYSCAKAIIEAGTDPKGRIQDHPYSLTPLSICICQHSVSLVRLLLEHGAKMSENWDDLQLARIRGNHDIIHTLLDAGLERLPYRENIYPDESWTGRMVAIGLLNAAMGPGISETTLGTAIIQASQTAPRRQQEGKVYRNHLRVNRPKR